MVQVYDRLASIISMESENSSLNRPPRWLLFNILSFNTNIGDAEKVHTRFLLMTLAATLVITRSLSCCTGSLGISWLWHFWRLYIARGDLVAFLTFLHHYITARGDLLVALVTFASSLYYCKLCSCNYNVYKCKYPKYVYTQEYWNHLINKMERSFG